MQLYDVYDIRAQSIQCIKLWYLARGSNVHAIKSDI